MRRLKPIAASLSICLLATAAFAYLASPTEIRGFWDRQRHLASPVYLSYESRSQPIQKLELFVRPDGAWIKRVVADDEKYRDVWKWGLDAWALRGGKWLKSERKSASWEDWAFEPNIDVLLTLTPEAATDIRGLGRHPEGYTWLYGARTDSAPGPWFALLPDRIRIARWASTNDDIGVVTFHYAAREMYPRSLVFQREGRSDFVLERTSLRLNPKDVFGTVKPDEVALDAGRLPNRPVVDVTQPTDR